MNRSCVAISMLKIICASLRMCLRHPLLWPLQSPALQTVRIRPMWVYDSFCFGKW